MGIRLRYRFVAWAAIAALGLAAAGCGAQFKLPTERRENRTNVSDKSYQMIATWTGLDGVADVLLIPGPQLYLAFHGTPGRVVEYSTTEPSPLAVGRFPNVQNPTALAANATRVFVLDQGDTAAARGAPVPGDTTTVYELACGQIDFRPPPGNITYEPRIIMNLSRTWFVREYDLKGREMKSAFSDTTVAWVNGIAADAQGRVYVSGVIYHCFVDQFDSRVRTLEFADRIYRYEYGSGDRYVVSVPEKHIGNAPPNLLPSWKRDATFEVAVGTGIGATHDPRGLSWSQVTGAALFFADRGNNEFQKFDLTGSVPNSFNQDLCDLDTTLLVRPIDVATDDEGNVYVVDSGNRRVLRYDPDGGHCRQRVDIEPNAQQQPLTGPVAVASGDFDDGTGTIRNFVYVVDAAVNQVIVYRRR